MKIHFRTRLVFIFTLVVLGLGPVVSSSQESGLVNLLVQKLGITKQQAQGGAGALFNLAKEKLSPQEFGQVAGTVPEMDGLLQASPQKSEGLTDMMGKGSSLFGGGLEQKADSAMNVTSAFTQLGMSPDMVNQFVPVILDFVQSKGGDTVKNLLAGALL